MESYQTLELKNLTEKIYALKDTDSEDLFDLEIKKFINEIISRKRNDSKEEGLQASGIISNEKIRNATTFCYRY